MFNFRLTVVLLTCFVLTGCGNLSSSRPVTKWSTDVERFSSWSNEALCSSATLNKKWETRLHYLPHVREAIRRGLTCGITTTPKKTCKTTPAQCSTIELCNFATKGSGSTKEWDTRYQRHVTLAKQKRYTCGVQVKEKKSCETHPPECDAQKLCFWATNGASGTTKWHDYFPNHVNEAKRRGLTCGVRTTSAKTSERDVSDLSNQTLCVIATRNNKWDTRAFYQPYVNEAKRRGLTCDITTNKRSYNNNIPATLTRAIDRLKRIGNLSSGEVQRLNQKLKKMEPEKLKALNTKCTQAYENLRPSLCENQLTKLAR